MRQTAENLNAAESAILVGVEIGRPNATELDLEASLDELAFLAETAGIEVLGDLTQNLDSPNPKTYIGSGKLDELKGMAAELGAKMVIFDEELSPRHQRELEQELGREIKVLDRTALILDIFAQHASTREGMLQVELAQLQYRLPRLTRAWTHLARQAGGGGGRTGSVGGVGLRGPGEQQLEVDRREIKRKISLLEDQIEKVRESRGRHRDQRRKSHIPVVSLVGYTNAGKSTLLNTLSGAGIYAADKLFATLDPTTRQLELPSGQTILMTDTVGFIQKLPTQLVAAFRATLEEIKEANLLLHVVDLSHPQHGIQEWTVLETLKEIGADQLPILTVYNKADLVEQDEIEALRHDAGPNALVISALTGEGIPTLLERISTEIYAGYELMDLLIPFNRGDLVSEFHEKGHVTALEHQDNGVHIRGYLPEQVLARYAPFKRRSK